MSHQFVRLRGVTDDLDFIKTPIRAGEQAMENKSTTTKETKPQNALMRVLMSEIRKYPECPECDNVISVAVRQNRRASYHCNWYAEWIVIDGGQLKCPHALEITKQLQAQFDLA